MNDLRGKAALVTGAAGGIGRCLALELARHGARLVLADIDAASLDAAAGEVRALGVDVVSLRFDLSDPAEVSTLGRSAVGVFGRLDVLVNNAGVAYYGPADRMTAAQRDRVLQVNLLTPIQLTHELLPELLARKESHVLNVCSVAGLVGGRKLAAYHASKFGLVGFSEALRAEGAGRGLGVTALCPGLVRTGLFRAAETSGKPVREPPRWLSVSPEAVAKAGVRAVRRNRGLVPVGPMAHALWWAKRAAPQLLAFAAGFGRKRRTAVPTVGSDRRAA